MKTHIVKNSNYLLDELGNIINQKSGSAIKLQINQKGYKCCNLYIEGKYRNFKLHKLIAEYFIPNPNNYSCINHIDGDKLNNSLLNLEWCTLSHNTKHAYKLGLIKRNKLFSDDIEKEIYLILLSKKYTQHKVAKLYNTNQATIHNIWKRQSQLWVK